jgi:hypothetical protein
MLRQSCVAGAGHDRSDRGGGPRIPCWGEFELVAGPAHGSAGPTMLFCDNATNLDGCRRPGPAYPKSGINDHDGRCVERQPESLGSNRARVVPGGRRVGSAWSSSLVVLTAGNEVRRRWPALPGPGTPSEITEPNGDDLLTARLFSLGLGSLGPSAAPGPDHRLWGERGRVVAG